MYQEELMDHFHHPRNRGSIVDADLSAGQYNPSCGDAVSITARIDKNTITEIAFEGTGCVISQATASMLTDYVLRKTLDEAFAISPDDLLKLIKIPLGPTRLKCALLSLESLKEGIKMYRQKIG